ncbi:MAG: bL17 family ribosomal protein, partial [Opitutales bacterium]
ITLAKKAEKANDAARKLHFRRLAIARVRDKKAVAKLFDERVSEFTDRPGGYTRIYKLGQRIGDAAEMALIELIDGNDEGYEKPKKKAAKKAAKKPAEKAPEKTEATGEDAANAEEGEVADAANAEEGEVADAAASKPEESEEAADAEETPAEQTPAEPESGESEKK